MKNQRRFIILNRPQFNCIVLCPKSAALINGEGLGWISAVFQRFFRIRSDQACLAHRRIRGEGRRLIFGAGKLHLRQRRVQRQICGLWRPPTRERCANFGDSLEPGDVCMGRLFQRRPRTSQGRSHQVSKAKQGQPWLLLG